MPLILPLGLTEKVKQVQGKDRYTKALLHMDGADLGSTFTDECGHAITNSSCLTRTAAKKFGTTSAWFGGAGDARLSMSSADFAPEALNFEVDFWFKLGTSDTTQYLLVKGTSPDYWLRYLGSGNNKFQFGITKADGTQITQNATTTFTDTTAFHHLKFGRHGGTLDMLLDNAVIATSAIDQTIKNSSNDLIISYTTAQWFTGYMDEFRLSIGTFRDNYLPACAYY